VRTSAERDRPFAAILTLLGGPVYVIRHKALVERQSVRRVARITVRALRRVEFV
jgi:hypothetical protein